MEHDIDPDEGYRDTDWDSHLREPFYAEALPCESCGKPCDCESGMTFKHYASAPFTFDEQREYDQHVHFKPYGFWLSVVGPQDWQEWCIDEDFGLGQFPYCVQLRTDADVLLLKTPQAIQDFTRKYRRERYPGDNLGISWPTVAQEFTGIIIAPHQRECRYHRETFWYSTWDCASGCIWDCRAISKIRPLRCG